VCLHRHPVGCLQRWVGAEGTCRSMEQVALRSPSRGFVIRQRHLFALSRCIRDDHQQTAKQLVFGTRAFRISANLKHLTTGALFVTASHPLLLNVTSRPTAFSLLVPAPATQPQMPPILTTLWRYIYINRLFTYLKLFYCFHCFLSLN